MFIAKENTWLDFEKIIMRREKNMILFHCIECHNVDLCRNKDAKDWKCPICKHEEEMKNKPLPCSECREEEDKDTLGFILDDLIRIKAHLLNHEITHAAILLGSLMTDLGHQICNAENQ